MGKAEIREVVVDHIDDVRTCYNAGLEKDPDIVGQVKINFVIKPDGSVGDAVVQESSLPPAASAVGDCIAAAMKTWFFRREPGGGNVVVTYPFNRIEWAVGPRALVLRLEFDDVDARTRRVKILGLGDPVVFSDDHATQLLAFGVAVGGPVLVHCAMGVSRSPACAILLAAQALGPGKEAEAAEGVVSYDGVPGMPNSLVVQVGDRLLGREGALVQAVRRCEKFV